MVDSPAVHEREVARMSCREEAGLNGCRSLVVLSSSGGGLQEPESAHAAPGPAGPSTAAASMGTADATRRCCTKRAPARATSVCGEHRGHSGREERLRTWSDTLRDASDCVGYRLVLGTTAQNDFVDDHGRGADLDGTGNTHLSKAIGGMLIARLR